MEFRVAHDGVAAVIRRLQPFVAVGRPGVGTLDAVRQGCGFGCGAGPQAECTVDMDPGAARLRQIGDLADGIEAAGVELAGLGDDDHRPVETCDALGKSVNAHAAHVVGRNGEDAIAPEAEILEAGEDGDVGLIADDDMNGRRTEQALRLDVPAVIGEHAAARRGKADEVGGGGAGREADRAFARQIKDVEEPAGGRLLAGGGARCRQVVAAILAPGAGEPIGCDANGMRAADHPAKEAWTRHGAQTLLGEIDKLGEDVAALAPAFRQRYGGEELAHGGEILLGTVRTRRRRGSKLAGRLRRVIKQRVVIGGPGKLGLGHGMLRRWGGRDYGPDVSRRADAFQALRALASGAERYWVCFNEEGKGPHDRVRNVKYFFVPIPS